MNIQRNFSKPTAFEFRPVQNDRLSGGAGSPRLLKPSHCEEIT